jgi:DNA-binding transcriptional MerR regulator
MMKSSRRAEVASRSVLAAGAAEKVPPDGAELTIDDVARAAGMTVRNVRAHQSRGLLPPPEVRGRTGYYGADHVARLELIRELQADGFNLAAIKRVLARTPPGAAAPTLEFDRELRRSWQVDTPEVVTEAELAARFGGEGRPDLTGAAVAQGLLVPVGEGSYEVPTPALLGAAQELAALGMPLDAVLDVARGVSRHADSIARSFVDLFVEQVWQPFEDAGRPEKDWQRISEALERCRPVAITAVDGFIRRSLEVAIEDAYGRALRHGTPKRPPRRRTKRV